MEKLTEEELAATLTDLPEWRLDGGQLVREWKFAAFSAAIAFVGHIAELAESMNHHPDIDIRYNRVLLALVTHDAGGISRLDVEFAVKANSIS